MSTQENFSRLIPADAPSRKRLKTTRNNQGHVTKKEYIDRPVIKANQNSNVEIFRDEAHMFHVLLTTLEHDQNRKAYTARHSVQSFTAIDFKNMVASNFFKQYDGVIVLHDPNENEVDANGEVIDETAALDAAAKAAADVLAAEAAEKLMGLREQYAVLFGVAAQKDATIEQLEQWIGDGAQQALTAKVAEIKASLAGQTEKDLKKEYKAITGKPADASWAEDQLAQELAIAMAQSA